MSIFFVICVFYINLLPQKKNKSKLTEMMKKRSILFFYLSIFMINLTCAQVEFVEISGSNNPFNELTAGAYACPDFVDIDNDNDWDVFFALEDGNIVFFENTGNHEQPFFEQQTNLNNPLNMANGIAYAGIAFADIDGDGDSDAFVSSVYAFIRYYKNMGSADSPLFEQQTGSANPLDIYGEGFEAKLSFVDIDNDQDLDVFIGDDYGTIRFYKNNGSATQADFIEISGANNPLNNVYVGDFAKPDFTDLDQDGDQDLILGEESGNYHYFENTGDAQNPLFTQLIGSANPFDGFNAGEESKPAFCDLDDDDDVDLAAGNVSGTIRYYENISTISVIESIEDEHFSVYPIPFNKRLIIELKSKILKPEEGNISLFDQKGSMVFTQNLNLCRKNEILVPDIHSGVYMLRLTFKDETSYIKVQHH